MDPDVSMTRPFEAGIIVADQELMERFYREALGCRPVHRSVVPREIAGPAGLGGELLVVWLQVPSGGRIKLVRPRIAAARAQAAVPVGARRGLSYLTFHLDDIEPVVAALPAARVPGRCRPRSWWRRAGGGSASGRIRRAMSSSWWTAVVIRQPLQ
ncbi:VOC family protein [Streptomyces sp. NPDC001843]|uniref:VOC family protein n=1 Tax=Streptomyces sp. NPDC001843 TaxID=3364617 RepID=UPI0036877B53